MIRYYVRHDIDVWKVYRQAPGEIRTVIFSSTRLQFVADFCEECLPGTSVDWNTRAEASFCFL